MTTTVIVRANHGWPVDVTTLTPSTQEIGRTDRVEAATERTFYVHSAQDLLIHEVQPSEIQTSAENTTDNVGDSTAA